MIRKKNEKQPTSRQEFAKEKRASKEAEKKLSYWQQLLGELLHRMLDLE